MKKSTPSSAPAAIMAAAPRKPSSAGWNSNRMLPRISSLALGEQPGNAEPDRRVPIMTAIVMNAGMAGCEAVPHRKVVGRAGLGPEVRVHVETQRDARPGPASLQPRDHSGEPAAQLLEDLGIAARCERALIELLHLLGRGHAHAGVARYHVATELHLPPKLL